MDIEFKETHPGMRADEARDRCSNRALRVELNLEYASQIRYAEDDSTIVRRKVEHRVVREGDSWFFYRLCEGVPPIKHRLQAADDRIHFLPCGRGLMLVT